MRQRNPPAEPATFEDLYAEHAPRVASLVCWLRVDARDQADVAQEVWIDVHQALATYDPNQGTERAWIVGITHNVTRNWRRTQRRRPELSTFTDKEPIELHTSEAEAVSAQQRETLRAFFFQAVPNADQREAFVLHEVGGLTVDEVAKETGAPFWTAQARIKMARSKLTEAHEALTDKEREELRAVVPLVSMEALLEAMRAPVVSDREIAKVWDRVSEQIIREGGSIHAPVGSPAPALPPHGAPRVYTYTGPQLVGRLAGVFVAGVLTGAGALYAFASHDRDRDTSIAMLDEARSPAPTSTPERTPEPAPSVSAAPRVTSSTAAAALESETALMERARAALAISPRQALALTNEHARRFRGINAAEREEIAIRALVQLGQRASAEERAARLVGWAPSKRPAMESLLGRSIF